MSARQHTEILQDDGFKQGRHQFVRWRSDLLQSVDIGFFKYSTLAGNFMELDSVIALIPKLDSRNLQFGVNFVDDRACAAGALIVHRRNFLLASRLFVIFEDDDLRILAAKLDN